MEHVIDEVSDLNDDTMEGPSNECPEQSNTMHMQVQDNEVLPFAEELVEEDLPDLTIDEAVISHKEALQVPGLRRRIRSALLNQLGQCLYMRYDENGTLDDLGEAIECHQRALSLSRFGHSQQASSLTNLAECFRARYEEQGDAEDLKEAITYNREALMLRPAGPERSTSLNNLAFCLQLRYQLFGHSVDLEDAISCNQEALALDPTNHPNRSASLTNLANCLQLRYRQFGVIQCLDDAITLNQEALSLCPVRHYARPAALINFATCLQLRYRRHGEIEDLEKAISHDREALWLHPPGCRGRSNSLNALAFCLRVRYENNGLVEDLEEAVQCSQEALALRRIGHPGRSSSLTILANCLRLRYERQGHAKDLDAAISCNRESLLLHPGLVDESCSLHNLAAYLQTRYKHWGNTSDLEEAITCNQEALELRPPGHPSRSVSLSSLADCFLTRYQRQRDDADLEEAISNNQAALLLCPQEHSDRSSFLIKLALCLQLRYHRQGHQTDLIDAINYVRDAMELQPNVHPSQAYSMACLASIYVTYSAIPGQEQRREEAWDLFDLATRQPTAAIHTRFSISLLWVAKSDRVACLRAYRRCLELADQYVLSQPSIVSRRRLLSSFSPSIAADAAAHAIEKGELTTAVEFLEQGRTFLWSQLGRYRSPLDKLWEVNAELAAKFEALSRQLETSAIALQPVEASRETLEDQALRYRKGAQEWNSLIEDIRQVDGFHSFLCPMPYSVLKQAASSGPVIIPNISRFRSDIIIVRKEGDPLVIPLPGTRLCDISEIASQFASALSTHEGRTRRKKILEILRFLWEEIVGFIAEELQQIGIPIGSRVWWCPTSKLTLLPVQAAGPYRNCIPSFHDLYISSYTPTLTALISSHHRLALEPSIAPTLLLIGQPNVQEKHEIYWVRDELRRIQRIIPSVQLLVNENGTHDSVIEGLRSHRWIHLALHGSQNLHEPFQSHFHLYDKPLTLLDIIQAQLPEAEFAFLSACHSASGDEFTPDETIHLATGLQFSGFRSVIGTLWKMADADGPVVAEEVYKYMFRRGRNIHGGVLVDIRDAAAALNIAMNILRARGVPVDRWISFVHIGA
ncbi:hypothetical protein FRC02_003040 [Tulasnella sp. 418]|nr:hypothetical protein FRC02_003040 [Tulasnella sp. 418]